MRACRRYSMVLYDIARGCKRFDCGDSTQCVTTHTGLLLCIPHNHDNHFRYQMIVYSIHKVHIIILVMSIVHGTCPMEYNTICWLLQARSRNCHQMLQKLHPNFLTYSPYYSPFLNFFINSTFLKVCPCRFSSRELAPCFGQTTTS